MELRQESFIHLPGCSKQDIYHERPWVPWKNSLLYSDASCLIISCKSSQHGKDVSSNDSHPHDVRSKRRIFIWGGGSNNGRGSNGGRGRDDGDHPHGDGNNDGGPLLANWSRKRYWSLSASVFSLSDVEREERDEHVRTRVAWEVHGRQVRDYYADKLDNSISAHERNAEQYGTRHRHVNKVLDILENFFLPDGYPESVSESYIQYSKWRGVQNIVGAVTLVLSTHCLLKAVGLGRTSGEVAAGTAAVNWVLKDGLGNLGRLLFARMGSSFDEDPKRYRLCSDILYDLGLGLEIATPDFPSRVFLPVAAAANALKAVAVTMGVSSRASVNKSFSLRENLGDITAKGDAQHVLANLLGMFVGIHALRVYPWMSLKNRLTFFTCLTAVYSYANFKCLQAVSFRMLNRQRGNLAVDAYIAQHHMPDPDAINRLERIVPFLPPRNLPPRVYWGAPLSDVAKTLPELREVLSVHRGDKYVVNVAHSGLLPRLRSPTYTTAALTSAPQFPATALHPGPATPSRPLPPPPRAYPATAALPGPSSAGREAAVVSAGGVASHAYSASTPPRWPQKSSTTATPATTSAGGSGAALVQMPTTAALVEAPILWDGGMAIHVALRVDTSSDDLLRALLETGKLRALIAERGLSASNRLQLIDESHEYSRRAFPAFKRSLHAAGWNVHTLLFGQGEIRANWH